VSVFVWNLTLDLSVLGNPASSYATTVLALGFIGTRKPHHHDKVEITYHNVSRHGVFFTYFDHLQIKEDMFYDMKFSQ
jgi:hypothetical protein